MLRIAVAACVLAVSLALPFNVALDSEWEAYKTTYNKQYAQEHEALRRMIWERNVRLISTHNLEESRGVHTYTLGMNEYGDMTSEEFVSVMNGYKQNVSRTVCSKFSPPMNVDLTSLPDTVDWRKEGYVTEIKNQGQCGSCWSFSATGSLEGQNFKKTQKLVSLSEKNLMDCSKPEGNQGCEGGLMDQAFAYVIKNKGIDTEESYPYKAKNGRCEFKAANIGATEVSCMDIAKGSETDLQSAVATTGPISVAIDASHSSFQMYRSGVYSERRCSSTKLDHGVLAVGYGTEGSNDYWLVKNSWGKSWGQEGYIMMSRNDKNQCGIATSASFPTM